MAIDIVINGEVTLDESIGLQTGVAATATEDNNDSDVLLSTLPTTFSNRLFLSSGLGGLGLSNVFANADGVAKSADNYITVTGAGSVVSLNFTTSLGAALPVYSVGVDPGTGAASGLSALDGGAIRMFSDLSGRIALGVDTTGNIVFALFLDPVAALTSAKVWMVQFEALANTNPNNFDDPLSLTGLGVGAGGSQEFNFDSLPSGANLFGIVGDANAGLVVFGRDIGLKADNSFISNQTQEVKTSQAGPNATIGIESQMFDVGDAAYFTFVNAPDPNFTGFGLGSTEADDADNILYGSTLEVTSAFIKIAQLQGSDTPAMSIQLYNIAGSPQGVAMINGRGTNVGGADPDVTDVRVYNAAGTLVESFSAPVANNGLTITINNGVATVTGFGEGYKIEWDSDEAFEQTLITGVGGKFDIGGFGANETTSDSAPLTGIRFEDDGPNVDISLKNTADLTVDESSLGLTPPVNPTDSITAGDLFNVVSQGFGTDGAGASGTSYKLVLGADVNSGLRDTKTDLEVILSINAAGTLISGKVNDGGLVDVFTIGIDPVTGTVTLTQFRALKNPDATDPDESGAPLTLETGAVSVQKTLTDGDGDSASDTVDISSIFKFEDDGPTQPDPGQDIDNFVTDDTNITDTDDDETTDNIFPDAPNFGADGPRATNPIVISLQLVDLTPLDGKDPDSGLVDTETGKSIRLVKESGDIVGYVDISGDGILQAGEKIADNEAIRYSLDPVVGDPGNFTVSFIQSRAIYHDPVSADLEETLAANTVFVQREAFDGDGDPAEKKSVDLGAITFIEDDDPAIGPIADGLVNFASGSSVNKTLSGVVGNDPNLTPYKLTAYTASLVVNGVDVHAVPVGDDEVGYWADTDGDTVFGSAGDTLYYKMKLGAQDGAGDYTFSVHVDPPPALTEFNFDDLPSGSNLFGIVGDASAGLVIFGKTIGLKADNTYISNQTQEVKTSQAGLHDTIGIESQMFDPGDAAYFTFVTNPDPNFTGTGLGSTEADDADNILYGATLEGTSAFIKIAQTQGGSSTRKMSIELFNIDDDDPQGVDMINARGINETGKDPDVIAVRVYAADGTTLLESFSGGVEANMTNAITIAIVNGVATVQGFNTNYKIEWDADEVFDQTLITGVSGKWDVGGFGFVQVNDTPDQFLQFTAQVTDGDGDTASDSWNIGIDGTGINDDDHVDNVVAII